VENFHNVDLSKEFGGPQIRVHNSAILAMLPALNYAFPMKAADEHK
jgi:hypothetical protein